MGHNNLITERVEHLYSQLSKTLDPSTFVLNKEIQDLMKENDSLAEISEIQSKCHHVYKDGICTICLMERDKK